MEKINLPFFYNLGATLNPVTRIDRSTVTWVDMYMWAVNVKPALDDLFSALPALTVCRAAGDELIAEVGYWADVSNIPASPTPPTLNLSQQLRAQDLIYKVRAFETVLGAELQTLATYHVSQKGAYYTPDLIERAEKMFPENIRIRLSGETVEEIRQSSRCLAFDNATASGFHIMRATEAVMHEYYVAVCKPDPAAKLGSWGEYIKKLRESGDVQAQEVVAIVQQVKDQHRNLIMHPEVVLSPDEAFTLFEIAQGAIITMANRLESKGHG